MTPVFARVMILVTIILMDILGGAEVDLFVPSFAEIQTHFNVSTVLLEALLSVNFAGYCLSLLFLGGLADRYGRKPIILLGLVIFIVGSSLCLLASSYNFLLMGRFLQGFGVAAPATLCFLIIADLYPIKKQQYFIGVLNGLINVAVAAAPVAGSYIAMYFHFQGSFTALLIMGALVAIMTMLFIPQSKLPEIKEAISLSGYITIFKSKPLRLLIVNLVFMFTPYWIFLGMSPILYMKDLGVSLECYGYYQGAWALIFALGSIVFGLVINKFPAKIMLNISAITCLIGFCFIVLVACLDVKAPLVIALSFMPFNIGGIIPFIILYPIALNFMPLAKARVSALIKGVMLVLTAVGIELAGYYYQGSFKNIGVILSFYIVIGIITLFFVIKDREINKFF